MRVLGETVSKASLKSRKTISTVLPSCTRLVTSAYQVGQIWLSLAESMLTASDWFPVGSVGFPEIVMGLTSLWFSRSSFLKMWWVLCWLQQFLASLLPTLLMVLSPTSLMSRMKIFLKIWIQSPPFCTLQWHQRADHKTFLLKSICDFLGYLEPNLQRYREI